MKLPYQLLEKKKMSFYGVFASISSLFSAETNMKEEIRRLNEEVMKLKVKKPEEEVMKIIHKKPEEVKKKNKYEDYEREHNTSVVEFFQSMTKFSDNISTFTALKIIQGFRKNKNEKHISFILQTSGGSLSGMQMIINAIQIFQKKGGKVTVYIPVCAFSFGTFIALACNEIVMDEFAMMSPFDPQIHINETSYPAKELTNFMESEKPDASMKLAQYMGASAIEIIKNILNQMTHHPPNVLKRVEEIMMNSMRCHDSVFTVTELKNMGLEINTDFPPELHELFNKRESE
jgi:ClpP class serine protease